MANKTYVNIDEAYKDLITTVLEEGSWSDNRTGIKTIKYPFYCLRYDMSSGDFPLLTTRKLPIKSTAVELEGFIKGITSKKWFEDRKCKYWRFWCNPEKLNARLIEWQKQRAQKYSSSKELVEDSVKLTKQFQEEEDDLGPLGYSWQWRNFGKQYGIVKKYNADYGMHDIPNGMQYGTDQLKYILDTLLKNPNDRRMVCSAWNPIQLHLQALPPCHLLWNVVITKNNHGNVLNLHWHQRSCDSACGIPQNIASYAMLLLLLAKHANMQPGILSAMFADCHIYENHIEGLKEQISRQPMCLPRISITNKEPFDVLTWTHEDIKLLGYESHPAIKFEVAI